MKSILLTLACAASLAGAVQAQTLSYLAQTQGGPGGQNYDNDYTGSPYPFYAQFGVNGTTSSPLDVNPEAGVTSVSITPITVSNDIYGDHTQTSSGLVYSYNEGTSPAHSSDLINGTQAGLYSVVSGFSGPGAPNQSSGQTLTFTLTFNQAVSYATFSLVANDYASSSTASFTLNHGLNAQTVSVNDPAPNYGDNDNFWDVISVGNVSAGDTLVVSDVMTGSSGNPYANISISGFTANSLVLETPEPSAYAMLAGGLALLVGILRFRSRSA